MKLPRWFTSALLVAACVACGGERRAATAGASTVSADSMAFRNAVTPPDSGWTGPVFQLSHDYPASAPGSCTNCPWLQLPVNFNSTEWSGWTPYLDSILSYVVQGQTTDLNDQTGWLTEVNETTRWFHVPWMTFDTLHGREFIHGTTNERTATRGDFVSLVRGERIVSAPKVVLGVNPLPGTSPDTLFETWAVGMYNEYGGYAIGQAIPSNGVPVAASTSGGNASMPVRFPQGTVVAKLLFTTATVEQVPYLAGSPRWTVDRHVFDTASAIFSSQRSPQPVQLIQMDVAVRDDRSPIGWVYGTYAYTGGPPGSPWWERMSPVGVQWGNDPQTWPAVDTASSQPISQTSLNTGIPIPQHDGCNGRLAGPVDNRLSACTACHGAAYAPAPVGTVASDSNVSQPFYFATMCSAADSSNKAYFANIEFPDPYSFPGVSGPGINLDTSLQLKFAYQEYASWLAAQP